MTQTEWLVEWWRLYESGVENKYVLLKIANETTGRKEILPRDFLKKNRHDFITQHVHKKRFPLGKSCHLCKFVPEDRYLVRHHIIALSNWGSNRRLNIIILCNRCHAYIHPWLFKTDPILVQEDRLKGDRSVLGH